MFFKVIFVYCFYLRLVDDRVTFPSVVFRHVSALDQSAENLGSSVCDFLSLKVL